MPETHHLIITDEALFDLQEIARFIRNDAPDAAAGVAESIIAAIDSLASMPDRFRRVGKSRKRGTPVHALVVRPFIIYYRVDASPDMVHILQVIHGARKQPRRFK